jgi:hypothetical protein
MPSDGVFRFHFQSKKSRRLTADTHLARCLGAEPEERRMVEGTAVTMIRQRYKDVFGAAISPGFTHYILSGRGASLGYRRAGEETLFVERYLDEPVEAVVGRALLRPVSRSQIIELGNLAATNAIAMIQLWGAAANDLGGLDEIAVATLTAPLRKMFRRIGIPIAVLTHADPERLGASIVDWGTYYAFDPQVCVGAIAEGQAAIEQFLSRRFQRKDARG